MRPTDQSRRPARPGATAAGGEQPVPDDLAVAAIDDPENLSGIQNDMAVIQGS
ncbi:MAG: hypothetical protein J0I04_19020 [Paenarthrobacter ureafaciens]|uniref:hypothetical protein n=1 Tax=Paenarthrobacter ureafaciens TaxID=37931 RepID=UPI001ACD3D06|nr:hypothetical protein [Paenarthrobacter ureafaciens]MBN9131730.1 hypothetical protein [Paenarthrobacter ureafaciens]